ncbi:MAG: PSD1 and planctomycete cytochrome C domain-containing protein [Gemmataceae bacterium]
MRFSFALALAALAAPVARAADDPKAVEFFETKIRPVLVEHCVKCHSADAESKNKLRGGLKLDTKAHWEKGGDTGAAVVPGDTSKGTLLKSLRYDGEVQMPPSGKLPAAVVADFERWIKMGAPDPRTGTATAAKALKGLSLDEGRAFWSIQPPKATAGAQSVDTFIAAKLAEKKLTPVGTADRRTLIRRATFDLHGLPPTPEEVEAFVNDSDPKAFEKLIERLLASPRYGERWARHWLDVARYAEDQAHTFAVTPKRNAYLYRDWVIKAFNTDMPFDRFVTLQLAGDLLPANAGETADELFTRLAGMGFLGLGAEYYKNTAREQAIAEELDDRVDVVSRAFLGLTVSCARCHDHKFDPIPTRDYYSLAGLFYGTNLTDTPLATQAELKTYNEAQGRVKQQEAAISGVLSAAGKAAATKAVARTADYLVAARDVQAGKAKLNAAAKANELEPYFLDRWVKFTDPANASKAPAVTKDWFALKADAKADAVKAAASAVQTKLAALEVPDAAPKGKAKGADPLAKAMFLDANAPLFVTPENAEKLFVTADQKPQLASMRSELESRKKASPPAPLQAHILSGAGSGMKVYIRGNPATKGEDAPKGFLQVLASAPAKDFTRLDLAKSIATPDNPLTARVFVNRVWAWHFGRGLVDTPSNFGVQGGRPSHPELLDWLAVGFVKNGWSTKWLHRQIMLSAAYQRSAEPNAGNTTIDAANVYLWRGSRRRLDVEAWRDSLLAVSGNLDDRLGGPTFDLRDANANRRTVYAKVSRHELDGLLRLFDFPDANVTADRRSVTTVPQQQLFALNSEFMVNQARAFAARVEKLGATDEARVEAAYRLAFNRAPLSEETALGLAFLRQPTTPEDRLTRWQQYAQALLASNEMMYVD